jgi:glycosyltransferase involved in cell wall biosynthesis
MTRNVIALLGRKDEPTDAVEEYCRYLAAALGPHEIDMQIRRVPWELHGWGESLHALELMATKWRGTWVFVQYTALAWSARGFPTKFARVLEILKSAGARIGIVFHDVEPFSSPRLIDQLRRLVQLRTMRQALEFSDLSIFTVLPEKLSWLKEIPDSAAFLPVGPNLPFPETFPPYVPAEIPTIGVFSITGGEQGAVETQAILQGVRHASQLLGQLRLSVFGRHSELREAALREGLRDWPVQLSVEGVLSPDQVVSRFAECGVLLFVRKGISTRRSSAIAGIAAALPIVAYEHPETAAPITDAGIILVNPRVPEQLGDALVRILSDPGFRAELSERSHAAHKAHFAWPAIAARFAELLRAQETQ